MGKLYRYSIVYNEECYPPDYVMLDYYIIRETEKCYWVSYSESWRNPKRISKHTVTQITGKYATTKELALKQFKWRLEKRLRWYNYWTNTCKNVLQKINKDGK